MKKTIITLLAVIICIAGYSQNRNAEIIEDLCEKYLSVERRCWYPRDSVDIYQREIGEFYIAGSEHPEYLKAAKIDNIMILGVYLISIYSITVKKEPLTKEDLREIDRTVNAIELTFCRLQNDYDNWLEDENLKKKNIRVNFKELL